MHCVCVHCLWYLGSHWRRDMSRNMDLFCLLGVVVVVTLPPVGDVFFVLCCNKISSSDVELSDALLFIPKLSLSLSRCWDAPLLFKAFAEGVSRGERLVVVIGVDPSSSSSSSSSIIRGSLFLYLRPKPKRNNKLSTNLIRCFAGKKKPEGREKRPRLQSAKNARAPPARSLSLLRPRECE